MQEDDEDPTTNGHVPKRQRDDESSSSDEEDRAPEANGDGVPGVMHAPMPTAHTSAHKQALAESAGEALPVGRGRGRGRGSTSQAQKKAQKASTRTSSVPAAPPVLPVHQDTGTRPLVNAESSTHPSESYTEDEKALNQFTRLHPMLSLEATSQRSLQLVANLIQDTSIPTPEVPTVPRSHDDLFLRQKKILITVVCLVVHVVPGPDTPPPPPQARRPRHRRALLLPGGALHLPVPGHHAVRRGHRVCLHRTRVPAAVRARRLPLHGEAAAASGQVFAVQSLLACAPGSLLQLRGWQPLSSLGSHRSLSCPQTYIHRLALANPGFLSSSPVAVQAFGNVVCSTVGDEHPTHASTTGGPDGYPPSAILVSPADFAGASASRTWMGTFQWRPVVAFFSSDYTYFMNDDDTPRIVQSFRQPVPVLGVRIPA
jgi:hypothetical protein